MAGKKLGKDKYGVQKAMNTSGLVAGAVATYF